MKIGEVIKTAAEDLKELASGRRIVEARLILSEVLKTSEPDLVANSEKELNEERLREFDALLRRRKGGEPLAYIRGRKEFFGLEFLVSPACLIPRPETEELVSGVLDWLTQNERHSGKIVDLGTGSGCVILSIANDFGPAFEYCGVDVSEEALKLAKENAARLQLPFVKFHKQCIFEAPKNQFDVIVSNPPYIPDDEWESLDHGIRKFEPEMALRGGPGGLNYYKAIIENWWPKLRKRGLLALETHDENQRQKILDLIKPLKPRFITSSDCHLFIEK